MRRRVVLVLVMAATISSLPWVAGAKPHGYIGGGREPSQLSREGPILTEPASTSRKMEATVRIGGVSKVKTHVVHKESRADGPAGPAGPARPQGPATPSSPAR